MMKCVGLFSLILAAASCSASGSDDSGTGSVRGDSGSTTADGSGSGGSGTDASSADGSSTDGSSTPPSGTGTTGVIVATTGQGGGSDVLNGECDQVTFQTKRRPTEILLLLDRSASMVEHEIASGVTRWQGVVEAVKAAVSATNGSVDWGLKLFPESSGNECELSSVTSAVDVPIAPANASAVNGAIDVTVADGDGTPTGDAVKQATAYLAAEATDGQKFILLATDGQPSCSDLSGSDPKDGGDARDWAVSQVTVAAGQGYPTFVLGVLDPDPSDSTLETLNSMAKAGGRPTGDVNPLAKAFYLATTPEALTQALAEITGEVASCEFPFDKAPPDPTNIAVKVNGEKVPQDATRTDGWEYTDDTHRGVEMYGSWCQQIQGISDNQIDFIFGCPGVPIK